MSRSDADLANRGITPQPLLEGRTTALYHVEPERLRIVGRDTTDGPEHDLWDDHATLPPYEEYVLSMMMLGVLEPVLCTVIDGVAFVVDGRRRIVAAREANKRLAAKGEPPITVPVVAKDGRRVGNSTFALVLVALNEIRRDDPPNIKMRKAARLVERGANRKMIAMAFGVTEQTIRDWLTIAASKTLLGAVESGQVSVSSATRLSTLPVDKHEAALQMLTAESPTQERADAVKRAIKRKASVPRARPAIGLVRAVLAHDLPPDFLRGVKWMLGELDDSEVPGLKDVKPPIYRRGARAKET